MNGKHRDHPINDICDYGLAVFSPEIDGLIREIHGFLPRYRMWDLFNWFNPGPMPQFEQALRAKRDQLTQEAHDRGWEDPVVPPN